MIDRDYLEILRANAEAVRADLEERESLLDEGDPQLAHEAILDATRPPMPTVVHKTMVGKVQVEKRSQLRFPNDDNGDDLPPPFTDEQIELLADTLAEFRMDFRMELQDMIEAAVAPLRDRIATLEGKLDMLTNLLNGNGSRSFEASEVIRKLNVR